MNDIVERLRAPVWPGKTARRALCDEAAAEVERLQAALLEAEERARASAIDRETWHVVRLAAANTEIERLQAALREAISLLEIVPDEITWATNKGRNTGGVGGIRHVETRLRDALSGKGET